MIPSDRPINPFARSELLTQLINERNSASDLPQLTYGLVKHPKRENDVILLFGALVGTKILRGYKIFSTRPKDIYDAHFDFELEKNRNNLFPQNNLGLSSSLLENIKLSPRR